MRHKLHPKVAPTANNNQPPLSPVRLFQSVPLWDSPLSKDPLGLRLQISSDADESRPTVDHPLRQSAPDEACLTSSNRTAPFPVEAVTEQGREQKGGSRHGPYLLISTAFLERHSSSALSALSALYTVRCFPRRWAMDKRPSHATACNSLGVVTCNRAAVSRTHVHHRPALLHLEGVSFGGNTLHMCNRDETGWSGRMRDERRNGKQPRFPGAIFFPIGLACKCTTDTGTVCDTALSLLRFTACVLPCCPILCLRLCPAPHCIWSSVRRKSRSPEMSSSFCVPVGHDVRKCRPLMEGVHASKGGDPWSQKIEAPHDLVRVRTSTSYVCEARPA